MEHVLACIDASSYADSVCDLAAWGAMRLNLPVELLHVVQRKDAVAARGDLSGAIGLGVKSSLMEELVQLEAADARLQVERGRAFCLPRRRNGCEMQASPMCARCTATAASSRPFSSGKRMRAWW